jgi:phospholipid-binding lipoprotein MlaA
MAWRLSQRLLLFALPLLTACAASPPRDIADYPQPVYSYEDLVPADMQVPDARVNDPWEGMNKRIYNFNYHFDRAVFIPVTDTYKRVMPRPVRRGVSNFFNNIRDLRTFVNSVLQLAPKKAMYAGSRVLLNTTVGLVGFIDVATDAEIPRPVEDFGQTLGRWGVGKGPYLVLPMFGPSNLRDAIGLAPDGYLQSEAYGGFLSKPLRSTVWVFDSIDTRTNVPFRYYETGSAFEYEAVRWLYSVKRDLDVIK